MAEMQIDPNHQWRIVVNLLDSDHYTLSADSEEAALAKIDEIIKQGAVMIRGVKNKVTGVVNEDWTYIIPLHNVRLMEVYEDDTIKSINPLRRAVDPKLRGARQK